MMLRRSITVRLVAMFAAAALATFALIGAALYGVLQHELLRNQLDELQTNLQNLEYSIERVGTLERWARVEAKMDTLSAADGSVRFWVIGDDPRFQYGRDLAQIERSDRDADGLGTIRMPGRKVPLRTLTKTLPGFEQRPAVRLIIGLDSAPYVQTLHAFLRALAALSLSAVLLVMLAGWWITRLGLAPLRRLSDEARALSPKTLAQRLQVARLPRELSDLGVAFNGALGRLEGAYTQLEAFNADVAHELRTPLANLIGSTQVALARERSAAQLEEVLQSNLEELERLRSIINDMLFLARADQGEAASGLVRTPIADEVHKTIEFFEVVLDELDATVRIDGDVAAQAPIESALFRRALSNLLQNAIEHSEPGAQLTVDIAQQSAVVRVSVSNRGAAIADFQLERMFDRFYRVDAARQGQREHRGHGLGLAIVKAVARMHGGSVSASCAGGVTTIGFSVPLAPPLVGGPARA